MHGARLLIMLLSTFLIMIIAFPSGMTSRGDRSLSASTTLMEVEPSPTYTLLGGTLTVNITVANVSDCAGAEFKLYWLSEKLNGTSVAEGPFIKQAGSTYFSITNFTDNYNSTCGLAWVEVVLLGPGPGAYGSGTVASISFKAKNVGSTGLWLGYTKLVDSAANTIPQTAISGIAYITFHNVAITGVTASKPPFQNPVTGVGQGYSLSINVTVKNQGNYTETFNATAYANTTAIETKAVNLTIGNSTTITFTWNTIGFARGNYTMRAYVQLVPSETNLANKNYTGGSVQITKVGDMGSRVYNATSHKYENEFGVFDGVVNSADLYLFLLCFHGTAPTAYMYLGDLGSRVEVNPGVYENEFFKCDGVVDSADLYLLLQCYHGLGPDP